jgi:chromosome segregation protein
MRLQRLKMTGFKSFADSVTIDFNPGVTAIVGPNGSGKSNVVDALAWVLGAQSPRLLRLTKMEELIYAGGDGRQPLGRAEVTIEFDNTDQQVSLPMAEIAMSRAITRNGDAQYRLNGAQCRLVDLVDTLSEANLGKTQHVIISQGEIESLANAKGDEIRAVLEDAAQVSTLRRRLGQSQRHVESVTQSLNEVALKERELRRRIKPLRSQVTLYEQREQLTRRRDAIALWVMRRRLEGYAEQAEEAKRALLGVTTRLEELGVDHDETEVRQSVLEPLLLRLRSLRQEASDLRGEVLEAMAPLNKLESTIARSDAELAMVTDELGRIDEAKAQVLVRIDELEQAGEALAARRGDLAAKRREAEEGAPTEE